VARAQQEEGTASVNKSLLSIDYASKYTHTVDAIYHLNIPAIENLETVDYLKEGDVGFKKPKACYAILLSSSDIDFSYL
jgi:U4/U6.U5 tri-snRNP-associated protein 1